MKSRLASLEAAGLVLALGGLFLFFVVCADYLASLVGNRLFRARFAQSVLPDDSSFLASGTLAPFALHSLAACAVCLPLRVFGAFGSGTTLAFA